MTGSSLKITACRILAGLSFCFCFDSGFSAAELVAFPAEPVLRLHQAVQFIEDKTGLLSVDDIRNKKKSEIDIKSNPNFGFIQGAIWVGFNLRFDDSFVSDMSGSRYFDTGTSLPTTVNFYHYYDNQLLKHYETGAAENFSRRPVAHRNFVFPLSAKPGEHQVWIRIESRNMVALVPKLKTIEGLASSGTRDGLLLGLLYGAILILLVFCSIAYFWTKEPIYLSASIIALCAGIWHGDQNGLAFQYLWPESPSLNTEMQRISIVLMILSVAWLNRLLSQVSEWSRRLDKLLLTSMALTALLLFVPLFKYSPISGLLLISSSPLIMLVISILAFRLKQGWGSTHMVITTLFFAGVIYSLMKAYGVIPLNEYSEAIGNFEFIGLFTLLSVLLAYKVSEDRIQAQAVRAADEAKRNFLANMSHEVRTPLNAIMGFSRLALNAETREVQNEYIKYIQDSSDNMLALVNQILDLSKVEAGKLDLELKAFNLKSLFSNIQSMFAQAAADKDLQLTFDYDQSIPSNLVGDPLRISQILINLVGNAIKFTSVGRISVSASMLSFESNKYCLKFAVRDTGVGINEKRKGKIFESFVQGEESTTRKFGGTGLGLTITRQLVELMGGEIELESKEGEGTSVFFYLKLDIDDGQSKNMSSEKEFISDHEHDRLRPVEDQYKPDISVLDNIKVLLVEDNDINQMLAIALLEKVGVKVHLAVNGEDALNKLREGNYELVLMDMQMPVMDGLEATRKIRNELKLKELPVIAMTANAMRASLDQCLDAGMNDYVTKPIDPELLYQVIGRWVNQSRVLPSPSDS